MDAAAVPHDPFVSSTAPLTFAAFLDKMRQPAAADIVKAIKAFLTEMLQSTPDAERDSERVQVRRQRAAPLPASHAPHRCRAAGLPELNRGVVQHAPALARRQCGGG